MQNKATLINYKKTAMETHGEENERTNEEKPIKDKMD